MYSIIDIAQYLMSKDGYISQKKLQKLCYYIQAWHLAFKKKKLIDCSFEAWVHGPVCKELYQKRASLEPNERELPNEVKRFIDVIYNTYGRYTGNQLENITHSERPWKEARGNLQYWEPSNNIISDDSMQEYYEGIIRKSNE
ncbi:Panacea domain-containing protein [Emergencia sp.]|uniref:Panacea domain-containing protein n=1 Tax=Emergencia sp. TaxID=1926557 RepID=UPI003AF098EC